MGKIITIDPSLKKVGIFIQRNENTAFFLIENKLKPEDVFLYQLREIIHLLTKDGNYYMAYEYTYIPRFKSASVINRVIGAILSLSPNFFGYSEITMPELYSFFQVKAKKDKKEELHKILREKYGELTYPFCHIILQREDIFPIWEDFTFKLTSFKFLPQDCLDAYALYKYVRGEK